MSNDIIKLDNPKDIMAFITDPVKLSAALTGVFASGRKDWVLSAGKLVQASLKFKLLTQLGKELNYYREKGKIKANCFATNNNQASFNEILSVIDEEVPDEERMRALKSVFLTSISVDATEEDEKLSYELMKICRKLSSGEILVLKANFEIVLGNIRPGINANINSQNAVSWLQAIAAQIGHNLPSLVEAHEENLIRLALISKRTNSDLSGFRPTEHFRLTKSGYKLCEFITRYP